MSRSTNLHAPLVDTYRVVPPSRFVHTCACTDFPHSPTHIEPLSISFRPDSICRQRHIWLRLSRLRLIQSRILQFLTFAIAKQLGNGASKYCRSATFILCGAFPCTRLPPEDNCPAGKLHEISFRSGLSNRKLNSNKLFSQPCHPKVHPRLQ